MSDALPPETARPRGRLKIFLGAAPGVGKTYEMLSDACERARAGDDVVAAVVDTHGRPETQALLEDVEIVPLRAGGSGRGELDLDAVLARAPQLALVDELAHVNAAGARHPRRWQDALELIEAGIDVYSTLNIQHVESLRDQVAAITRMTVGDTVPDSLIEEAELEVVDLPPDELLRRLEEGKVKIGAEESRVLSHYFSRPALSALRELVLRRTAQSIDKQMVAELAAGALPGLFQGSERVLVAVSELPGADGLVRAGKRLADALRAPWAAIYIETPRAQTFSEAQKRRVADCMRLAATLGATIATVPAETVTEGLAGQVEALRATQLVIGKSQRSWWFTVRHGSVVEKMMRMSDGLAVHVLPAIGGQLPAGGRMGETPRRAGSGRSADYGAVLGLVGITTLLGRLLEPAIGVNALDLFYLLPVILCSVLFGLRPALTAGAAAGLAYNFFFLEPRYTLSLMAPEAVISLLVLVGVAAFTSRLAGRLKTRATLGVRSAQDNAAVAAFAQTLARVSDRQSTARAVCDEVARLLDVDAILLAERDGKRVVVASQPEGLGLGPVDEAAVDWAWQRGEQAGVSTATLNAADWLFVPLKTSLGTLAVLGVARESGAEPVPADRAVLLSALVGQAALAHERLYLEDDMRQVATLKAKDTLRTSLLSAMGRDLAQPLRLIASALDEAAEQEEGGFRLAAARQEANRLQRFLGDLIDMVAIDSGEIPLDPEPTDLAEAVSDAAHDIHDLLRDTHIDLHLPGDLPRVAVDRRMLHHILVNLLSNAVRDAGEGAMLRVAGHRTADAIELAVERHGSEGAPVPADTERHLGLALVKGFANAIGVSVMRSGQVQMLRFPETLLAGSAAAAGDDERGVEIR